MKKTLGVVAAAAMAATPMFGVLAEGPVDVTSHTDNISVNIGAVCTLGGVTEGVTTGVNATTHANGDGSPALGAWDKSDASGTNTLSGTMIPGSADADFGSSTFTIKCNNAKGYTLSAIGDGTENHTTQLYDSTSEKSIATADGTPAKTSSAWAFKFESTAKKKDGNTSIIATGYDAFKGIPAASTVVASQDKANDLATGETVKVTYAVSVSTAQEEGTYTGAVAYTLAQVN